MPLHTDFYTIQPRDINVHNTLTTPVLFDFMQQSAQKNAASLGVGVDKMRETNLAWVLNRLKLTVVRYPKLGETVALSTYPVRIDKYFVYRDFQLFDNQGVMIASAVSVWLLLDLEKRTMASVPSFIHEIKYPDIPNPLEPMSGKVLPLKTVGFMSKRIVSAEDVDFNDHASNVAYVKWLVESMPSTVQNACFIHELDINYRAECYLNEAISVETVKNGSDTEGSLFQQKIVRDSDKKDLVWANVLLMPL
jgi:medium-chain acyl-[acyl-carrier-protein] hydrolase